jgi:transposase
MTKAAVGSLGSPQSPSGNSTLQGGKRAAYKALSPVQKTEIISAKASGMSGLAISKLFDIGKTQVYSVLQRWDRNKDLSRRQGSGRPRKSTAKQDQKIILDIKRNPGITVNQLKLLNPYITLCESSYRNRIHDHGEFGS